MSQLDVDLNIDNYNLEDILDLFKIDNIDSEANLAKAKSITLKMHPDKSGLDKDYFLFFSKAYKILYQLYIIQDKTRQKGQNIDYENYKETINKDNRIILDKITKKNSSNENFNKWFNNEFEKMKLTDEYTDKGYGDWLNNNEDENSDSDDEISNCNSVEMMHKKIEKRRNKLSQLVKHKNIMDYNDGAYCDIGNNAPDNYSSDMFSKLSFQDLKQAHTETIIPVNEKDCLNKKNYSSIKAEHGKKIAPLNEKDAINMLGDRQKIENKNNVERMYKLIKQQEEVEKKNVEWWKKYKLLK